MTEQPRHRYLGLLMDRQRFVARCSCSWRSQRCASAAVAGAVFDQHLGDAVVPSAAATTELARIEALGVLREAQRAVAAALPSVERVGAGVLVGRLAEAAALLSSLATELDDSCAAFEVAAPRRFPAFDARR